MWKKTARKCGKQQLKHVEKVWKKQLKSVDKTARKCGKQQLKHVEKVWKKQLESVEKMLHIYQQISKNH